MADTHLGCYQGRTKKAREVTKQAFFDQLSTVIDAAISNKADYLIHAGDVFNRSSPPKWAKDQFYGEMERALNNDIGVLIVPGNHDRAQLDHSLLEFYYPNFHLFNDYQLLDIGGIIIAGFPFQHANLGQLWSKIRRQTSETSLPAIIICHQLFRGATFGPHKFVFKREEGVLSLDGFGPHVQVITGHVHRAQQLSRGQVTYTGSTARTSFVEVIEPKGYLLVDVEYDHIHVSFNEIPSLPMRVVEMHYPEVVKNGVDQHLYNGYVRQLLRITRQKMRGDEIKALFQKLDAQSYPLLSISPRTPGVNLYPLYSSYQEIFEFPVVERFF